MATCFSIGKREDSPSIPLKNLLFLNTEVLRIARHTLRLGLGLSKTPSCEIRRILYLYICISNLYIRVVQILHKCCANFAQVVVQILHKWLCKFCTSVIFFSCANFAQLNTVRLCNFCTTCG